jgi:Spy/CpxP family protein refolding chaperone
MRPNLLGRVLSALLLAGLTIPALAQTSLPWWNDPKFVKDLGLTPEQSAKIDHTFRKTYPQLRQASEELDRQEDELSRLIAINADEPQVERQIDKVEAVRASLNKTRTLMLLHMVRAMSPEQRAKFKPLHDQWTRDHPRPPRTDAAQGRAR